LAVVGGGKISRRYIEAARKLGASNVSQDILGIDLSRVNARLLITALGRLTEPDPFTTFESAIRAMLKGKIPVMGGVRPGQTTDAVAAMLARSSRSELLVYLTDVEGVYSADPKISPKAKKFETMTAAQLVSLVGKVKTKPGVTVIVEPIAAKIIQRYRIRTLILGKREIKRLPQIIKGGSHSGTTIIPE
jgi:uridylate kinase